MSEKETKKGKTEMNSMPKDPTQATTLEEVNKRMSREGLKEQAYLEMIRDLAAMQSGFKPIATNKENPYYKSKYADMTCIMDYLRPFFSEWNFAITHENSIDENGRELLTTYLLHTAGGAYRSSTSVLNYKAGDPQARGKAQTYCERYNTKGLTGVTVVDEDDDAEGAMNRTKATKTQSAPQPRKVPSQTSYTQRQVNQENEGKFSGDDDDPGLEVQTLTLKWLNDKKQDGSDYIDKNGKPFWRAVTGDRKGYFIHSSTVAGQVEGLLGKPAKYMVDNTNPNFPSIKGLVDETTQEPAPSPEEDNIPF